MNRLGRNFEDVAHRLAAEEVSDGAAPRGESDALLAAMAALGTELWIDTGDLDLARSVWKNEFGALTTNNTLANQVVQKGVMDDVIRKAAGELRDCGLSGGELTREVGFVINCKIALRLVNAFRCKVSVELHPAMAEDLEKTLYYARRYFKVCPRYFIVKIPLTPAGYLAVRRLAKEGIPINYTLGFSARQNYLAALLSNPAYVNVFLGRLNQVVIDNGMGAGNGVGERVTWATQKAIAELRRQNPQIRTRLIGASIRNGAQVAALAGLDVLTIPPAAAKEFMASAMLPRQIVNRSGDEFEVGIAPEKTGRFQALWIVPPAFMTFAQTLLLEHELDAMSGEALVKYCEKYGVDLFYQFSAAERQTLFEHGKIPKLAAWPDKVALDDLMTQSALQSFAKDQAALDGRINSFLTAP